MKYPSPLHPGAYTEVCKPLLASGQWHGCSQDYAKVFAERAHSDWPGKQVAYNQSILLEVDSSRPAPVR